MDDVLPDFTELKTDFNFAATSQSVEVFKRDGFVVISASLSPEFLARVERARHILPQLYQNPRVDKIWKSQSGAPKHLVAPHLVAAEFKALITAPEVLGFVEMLWPRSRIYLYNSKVSFKQQGENQRWVPHQDSSYKPRLVRGLTVCIFLEDCGEENGTIQVFPRSHELGKLEHRLITSGDCQYQTVVKQLPKIEPQPINAKAGSILIMSSDMIHQSQANTKPGNRPIFIFEFECFQGWAIDEYEQVPMMIIGEMTQAEKWRSQLIYNLSWSVLQKRFKKLLRPLLRK